MELPVNLTFLHVFMFFFLYKQVVDLSRNNLDGIEPLLMVKPHSPEGVPKEKACTSRGMDCVYPLSGVIELGLNGYVSVFSNFQKRQ